MLLVGDRSHILRSLFLADSCRYWTTSHPNEESQMDGIEWSHGLPVRLCLGCCRFADDFRDPIPTTCLHILHCRWRFHPLRVFLLWHSHPSGRQWCPQLASCDCSVLWASYCDQHLGANCEDTECLISYVAWQIDFDEYDGENTMIGHHGGLVTLLEKEATNNILRVWCAPHQMDIVIKKVTKAMMDGLFYKIAHAFSVHLHA